jgi:hypothetical protein
MRTITIEIATCLKCPDWVKCEFSGMGDIPDTCPIWLAAEKAKAETAMRIAEVANDTQP